MKLKTSFYILIFVLAFTFIPVNVFADNDTRTFPLDKGSNYYYLPVDEPHSQNKYLKDDTQIIAINEYYKGYVLQEMLKDGKFISFTDIYSNNPSDMSFTQVCGGNGCNASFSIELQFTMFCGRTQYCGYTQTLNNVSLNDTQYDNDVQNLKFLRYLSNNIEFVYKDFNGRVWATKMNPISSLTFSTTESGGNNPRYINTNRVAFVGSTTQRNFAEFVGIRFNYNGSLLDVYSNTSDVNTIQTRFNNNVALNYNTDDVGVEAPIPPIDKSQDPMWYLYNDTYNPSLQNSTLAKLQNKIATNATISQLILLPVTMWQRILILATNGVCSPYDLGSLFGTHIYLPCINLKNVLGSPLWHTIDLIISAFLLLGIRKKLIEIFNNMTMLKERGNEIE